MSVDEMTTTLREETAIMYLTYTRYKRNAQGWGSLL